MNSVVFAFDGDALLVANTGAQFTRKGVVSICNMDLSAKAVNPDYAPDDEEYGESDDGLVRSILEKHITEYGVRINRLKEDANREYGAGKSYTGRFVWELLQNADDAMDTNRSNANLIGAKGIGFKSILEITDEPEIYSGDFCFHFSRAKSREKLEQAVPKWETGMRVPVCRLPHPKAPDSAVQKLFDEGHVTVLRLPLNEQKRDIVEDRLSGFCARSLLFCQNIESVYMQIGDTPRDIKIHRGDDGRVELIENGISTHWQVWDAKKNVEGEKRLSVRMCLPVVDGKTGCLEDAPRLHVFFPTAEPIPNVHALIHVSCEVDDNRQHLASDQPHSDKICEMLASMTKKILSDIPPNVALHAFGRAQVTENAGDGMVMQLRKAIAKTVQETSFIPLIGGGMAKPGDVRLWKHGLGNAVDPSKVRDQNLCHPDINDDEKSAAILAKLGAECAPEPELAGLLRFCRNRDEKDCLMAWNVAQTLMRKVKQEEKTECAEELCKAPFWLSSNGEVKARAIDGEIPLAATKPNDLPHWLPVDVIDKGFRKTVQDEIKRQKKEDESWKNALSGSLQPPENKRGYFDQILLPYCEKLTPEEWQKNGWKVLELAFRWGERDGDDEPLVIDFGNAGEKQKRAKIFHLPVGQSAQKWAPALQCYAGEAWGGPRIFDRYFAKIEDRYVLSPTKDWEVDIQDADKNQWENLLSWLGCSWMLKIKRENGLYPKRPDVDHTQGKQFSDFCFEHFDEMFVAPQNRKASDYVPLLNMVSEMYKIAHEKKARYYHYKGRSVKSRALKQLKENEWVPCKQSLLFPDRHLFKPEDAYLPVSSLGGLLPEVYKPLDQSAQDAIKELGAKDNISQDPEQLILYMDRLNSLPRENGADFKWAKDDKGRGKIARAAKAIFSAYAKIENRPPLTAADVMVPCLRHTRQGEEVYFEKATNVRWADKSYFDEAEVRREILDAGNLHVFFRFLQDGEAFGLDKLSEHLRLGPQYGDENPEAAEELRKQYDSRRVGMAKATGQNLPERLEIVAYENIALKAPEHAKITIQAIKFWKQNERKVDINAGADKWQGLAAALGELTGKSQDKPAFELLLKEKTRESFLVRLRNDYGLTEESIEKVKESANFEKGNAGSGGTGSDDSTGAETQSPGAASSPATSGEKSPEATTTTTNPGNNTSPPGPRPEAPKITVVPDPWEAESGTQRGTGVRKDAGDNVHEVEGSDGKRGEEALLEWLKGKYGDDNVTNKNEQNPNHPGYDILVKKNGEEHYYECKSFVSATPPRRVSMTKTQLDKAKHAGNRYWLCVICDANADPVKMLEPRNPAALENEPVITKYEIDLTSRKSDTE